MDLMSDLKRDGYARIPNAVSSEDLAVLTEAVSEFYALPPRPWSDQRAHRDAQRYEPALFSDDNWSVVVDFVGLRPKVDRAIENLVSNPILRSTMERALGAGYKLWQVTLRRAEPGGPGMRLHQDAQGEFGLSVLLTDAPTRNGATSFIRGTHRWPISITDVAMGVNPAQVPALCSWAGGDAGDAWFFINRTWHGRFANTLSTPAISLMFGFFAQGASYPIHHTPRAQLEAVGPELRRLLDPGVGVKPTANGRAIVERAPGLLPRDEILQQVMEDRIPSALPWKLLKAVTDGQRQARARVRSLVGR
jgi:putative 2OG-Fe(II) oxygenase